MTEKNELVKYLELPKIVDVPYPYLALGDIEEVIHRVSPGQENLARQIQRQVFEILMEASPEGTTFLSASMKRINGDLEKKMISKIEIKNGDLGVVLLDRYIGASLDNESIFRLNLSRGINGKLNSRPGTLESPETQVDNLVQWVADGNFKEVLLVDDVLAFGDTLVPLVTLVKELLPESEIKILVGVASSGGGWSGVERVYESTGVEVEALTIVKAGDETEWTSGMALPTSRDFTFFGGKVFSESDNGAQFNFPYFLPFSAPVVSFMPKEDRLDISKKCLDLSLKIVEKINKNRDSSLTLGDLSDAGFGVPWSNLKCLQEVLPTPRKEIQLYQYLEYFQFLLQKFEKEIMEEVNG